MPYYVLCSNKLNAFFRPSKKGRSSCFDKLDDSPRTTVVKTSLKMKQRAERFAAEAEPSTNRQTSISTDLSNLVIHSKYAKKDNNNEDTSANNKNSAPTITNSVTTIQNSAVDKTGANASLSNLLIHSKYANKEKHSESVADNVEMKKNEK